MRGRIALLVALLAALPAAAAAAGEGGGPWTLERLIAESLESHPGLLAARQQAEAVRGRSAQEKVWPNPEVELSAEDVPVAGGGLSRSTNLVGVTQTVPFPSKTHFAARAGEEALRAARWEYRAREAAVVRDVKVAFAAVVTAERRRQAAEELHDLMRSLAEAMGKRVRAGDAPEQERLRAEVEAERAGVAAAAARRDVEEARAGLARLAGRPAGELRPLGNGLRETVDEAEIERVRGLLAERNPTRQALVARREMAAAEMSRAGAARLPDLTLGFAYGRDAALGEDLMEFRVALPLPLFDRSQGRRREARALAEAARHELALAERTLAEGFAVAEARVRTAGDQVDTYRREILPKSREALRMVRGGYEAGRFGFLDLVDTQRTAAEVEQSYWENVFELNVAMAEMEALVAAPGEE